MSLLIYEKAEKIYLRNHDFNEKWLQEKIESDTTILGLGDLDVIYKERKQSSGGRIDFLLLNSETETMYETEIMLGKTDESHIIRTIEYWDIERKRYPTKEHRAVIIAEEITNRFFNVISLMSTAIPIIAIQLNALKLGDKILLNFTKVLDLYEAPEDEEKLGGETVDRAYWVKKSNPDSMAMMDQLVGVVKESYPDARLTYNKHHIALGTTKINFIWFHPRKNHCHLDIRIGAENLETTKNILDEIGISYSPRRNDSLALGIQKEDLKKHFNQLREIILKSLNTFS